MEANLNSVSAAQQKCWDHIETSTKMVECLEALKAMRITSAIPILSDAFPTLMITPEHPDDIDMIRALCRVIQTAMKVEAEWQHLSMGDQWHLRLKTPTGINIDVITHLPTAKETPISL